VVPGGRGDDHFVAAARELRDDGERAAPLEDAELVDVLSLQPEIVVANVARESRRGAF
jgi:hypothetical protein